MYTHKSLKLVVLALFIITLIIFSGCGTPTLPDTQDNADDSEAQAGFTPGGIAYAQYNWPQPLPVYWDYHTGFFNFDIFLTIDIEPKIKSDYFWAHQFKFIEGNGGYLGLQTSGSIQGQKVGKMAIFSIWDAIEAEPGLGATCEYFTGEGEGWSCRIPYEWIEGRTYCLRIWELCCAELPLEDEWWSAWIIDTSTGQETFIGKIKIPSSWQWLNASSIVWVEYYGQVNGCNAIPYAKARIEHPTADNDGFFPQEIIKEWGDICINSQIIFIENQGVIFETGG